MSQNSANSLYSARSSAKSRVNIIFNNESTIEKTHVVLGNILNLTFFCSYMSVSLFTTDTYFRTCTFFTLQYAFHYDFQRS